LKSAQSKNEVYFYTWGEYEEGRGSNVICSGLYDFLVNFINKNPGIKKIRLVCDSCGGQNKNYAMLSMISTIANKYKIHIEWIFPIVGHSYMPPDRAFGRVEKLLRKEENLLQPKDYFEILVKWGRYAKLV